MTDPIECLEDALELLREALTGWAAADEADCYTNHGACHQTEECDQHRINEIRKLIGQ